MPPICAVAWPNWSASRRSILLRETTTTPSPALLTRKLERPGPGDPLAPGAGGPLRKSLPRGAAAAPALQQSWKPRSLCPGARRTVHFQRPFTTSSRSPLAAGGYGSPFSGKLDRGWIYGRGTADMSGSIASLLLALQRLARDRRNARA